MLVRCVSVLIHPGLTLITNEEKKKDKGRSSGSESKRYGKDATNRSAEILFFVEINGKASYVTIDEEFRRKFQQIYAQLNKDQMERIKATMPREINVRKTDDLLHRYRVENKDIDEWYARVLKI